MTRVGRIAARRADKKVVDAVAVRVPGVGHRESVPVVGRAVHAIETAAGTAGVDVGRSAVGERLADDRFLHAVAVDVAQVADRPAEVGRPVGGGAVELLQHLNAGLDERPGGVRFDRDDARDDECREHRGPE